MRPHARQQDLLVQDLPDETLIYDLRRHRALCLNRTAALVWRLCDGQATIAEVARHLQRELQIPVDDAVVWLAVDQLGKAGLLQDRIVEPPEAAGVSRRAVIRRLGLASGVALLLPTVQSILAPTPASAVSCVSSCVRQPRCTPCNPYKGCKWRCDGSGNCKNNVSCP